MCLFHILFYSLCTWDSFFEYPHFSRFLCLFYSCVRFFLYLTTLSFFFYLLHNLIFDLLLLCTSSALPESNFPDSLEFISIKSFRLWSCTNTEREYLRYRGLTLTEPSIYGRFRLKLKFKFLDEVSILRKQKKATNFSSYSVCSTVQHSVKNTILGVN